MTWSSTLIKFVSKFYKILDGVNRKVYWDRFGADFTLVNVVASQSQVSVIGDNNAGDSIGDLWDWDEATDIGEIGDVGWDGVMVNDGIVTWRSGKRELEELVELLEDTFGDTRLEGRATN